ncbi:MAG: acetyl-CoA carboxylase biotin carboxyl carrier protein subunit [Bacteroidia bacterium]|nr:acetyl-CoA carboxylase biotin carboxyl carrier protein subunit [Bacteroidia bacterium]
MTSLYKISVNQSTSFEINKEQIDNLDIVKTPEGNLHLIFKSRSITAELLDSDLNSKTYVLRIRNNIFKVQINDQLDILIADMGLSEKQMDKIQSIKAPMPGLILDLMVETSQEVSENDPLLILEAMKMENIIKSPRAGIIRSVHVKKEQAIDKNTLLIEFE